MIAPPRRRTAAWAVLALSLIQGALMQGALPAEAQTSGPLCASPGQACGAVVSSHCLQRIGAGTLQNDASIDAACDQQLARYRDCLGRIAELCTEADASAAAPNAPAPTAADMLAVWTEVKDSGDAEALDAFAENFPNSALSALARRRADALRSEAATLAKESEAAAVWAELQSVDDPDVLELFAERHKGTTAAPLAAARAAALRADAVGAAAAAPTPAPTPALKIDPQKPLITAIQRELARAGYAAGAADGVMGPRSRGALKAFEADLGRAPTGRPSQSLLAALKAAESAAPASRWPKNPAPAIETAAIAPPPRAQDKVAPEKAAPEKAAPEKAAPAQDPAEAAEQAPPETRRAAIAWEDIVALTPTFGNCETELRRAEGFRYQAEQQRCQGDTVSYDLTIEPDGAITGHVRIFAARVRPRTIPVTGVDGVARGQRTNLNVWVRLQ